MLTLKTFVVVAAALGAVSGKKAKRQCSSSSSLPEPTSTPAPTEAPTSTETSVPQPTDLPGSGGGEGASGEYSMTENWVGESFYDGWDFWANGDPTHGRVTYVDGNTAKSQNLSVTTSDSWIMRADASSTLDPGGPGRNSVRVQSKKSYTTHVAVLDVAHIPQGPGTWPAYWMCGDNWPYGGEFDIIEGVNDGDTNLSSLHTGPDCTQPDNGRDMKGHPGANNCDANASGNQGCGVGFDSNTSFGPSFNQAGGGYYATERTETSMKVWFWQRDDPSVPEEVKSNTGAVSPSTWGTPRALFVSDSCDLNAKFGPNAFIINLTLCGDWAGNAYPGGMDACNDQVNNNPSAYTDAFWDIKRMNVYEK
ncbi:endo-1,3(4)-beta-glucanase [Exidia glandulosa HHB12029]|uniref:Endo-1,3(4)-beta-glucanase n=1 Tax=Exidia glandulosa HHB12029 TaxID=1314781 RepID=A0A165F642_EXIGL|nr:endo-1,3(4)-beta-glucanase [Exidia glandulosa HHB12029]